jgi:hypothetical protein
LEKCPDDDQIMGEVGVRPETGAVIMGKVDAVEVAEVTEAMEAIR